MQHWWAQLKFAHGSSLWVQHAACSETPPLHFKYFRGRRRITWLEMNALIRWRLEPCRGIIVFCISILPHYQWLWTKSVSQMTNGFKVWVCARTGACVCCLSSNRLIDMEQGVTLKLLFVGSGATHKQRVSTGTALFLLPCSVPLRYYEPGNRGCQEMRWPPTTCTQQGAASILMSEKAKKGEKKRRVITCSIWGGGSVVFSGITLVLFGFFISCAKISAAGLF